MAVRISKSNSQAEFFNTRLDEIRMSDRDRLRAKESFARAEAFVDAAAAGVNLVERLLKALVLRPFRRLTASIG
jgi:hypothetical protein